MGMWRTAAMTRVVTAAVVLGATAVAPMRAEATTSEPSLVHLQQIVDRSQAPTYRRLGSPGMAAAADYAATVLDAAGYEVRRHDVRADAWNIDYATGHAPSLERIRGTEVTSFPADSSFYIKPTGSGGLECVVRPLAEVTAGECAFVPFATVSPEWKNISEGAAAAVSAAKAAGAAAVILQGDVARQAFIARKFSQQLPVIVSPVAESEVVGETVRIRAMGAVVPATLHNVVGVRPPVDPAKGYLLLQAHMDGFYEAAVDNGTGAAAVLAAAEELAGEDRERGLIVALYDGEEWGLIGSKKVAAEMGSTEGFAVGPCAPDVHLGDIAAVVNLDASSAIASDADGMVEQRLGIDVPLFSWRAMVFSEEPLLPEVFLAGMAAAGVLGAPISVEAANPINGGVTRTDGRWFHEAGLAVVWPVAGYPEYHTSADTMAAVDPVDLAAVTNGTVNVVRAADRLPVQRRATLGDPGSFGEKVDEAACTASTPVVDELSGGAGPLIAAVITLVSLVVLKRGRARRQAAR